MIDFTRFGEDDEVAPTVGIQEAGVISDRKSNFHSQSYLSKSRTGNPGGNRDIFQLFTRLLLTMKYSSITVCERSIKELRMPKTLAANKPVRSFRLSYEGVHQLKDLARTMGRSESDVLEVALDRMYREEIRYNRRVREGEDPEREYKIKPERED
jgi:hypothetical protein